MISVISVSLIRPLLFRKILTLLDNNNQQQHHKQITTISPYERFYLALMSCDSKIQYPCWLQRFLKFLQVEGSNIDEKCLSMKSCH